MLNDQNSPHDIFSSARFKSLFLSTLHATTCDQVPRLDEPSRVHFKLNVARAGTPFIFTDDLPEDLSEVVLRSFRDCTLRVRVRTGNYMNPCEYAASRIYVEQDAALFFQSVMNGTSGLDYAGNQPLPTAMASSLGFKSPSFFDGGSLLPPSLWLGGAGCGTPLHKDSSDNIAFQLIGAKLWTLYSISDAPFLYLRRLLDRPWSDFSTSEVDFRSPDLVRFPLFRKVRPISVITRPGDYLFVPEGWSHHVETLEPSLMINAWIDETRFRAAVLGG